MEVEWWRRLSDNALVTGFMSATHSYLREMKELIKNTLEEIMPPAEPPMANYWTVTSQDMAVLVTAVCSLFGLAFSLFVVYASSRSIYWICCGSRSARIETIVLMGGLGRSAGQSKSVTTLEVGRWYNQAWLDLKAARNDFDGDSPAPEWVCYKCHQAVEKALKAVLISQQGSGKSCHLTHDILHLATLTRNPRLISAATQLRQLLGDPRLTRYPDLVTPPGIPRDVYLLNDALTVHQVAQNIVTICRQCLQASVWDDDE